MKQQVKKPKILKTPKRVKQGGTVNVKVNGKSSGKNTR